MNIRRNLILCILGVVLLTSLLQQNIYILVIGSLLLWVLVPLRKWWGIDAFVLLIFSLFYTIMSMLGDQPQSGFVTISYIAAPVAFYRLGYYFMNEYTTEESRFRLLLFVGITYLLNLFIISVADISVVGIVSESRSFSSLLTDADSLSATLYGLMASFGIGCVGAVLSENMKPIMRLLFFLLVLLSVLTVIHLVNRGGLIIFLCSLLISIILKYRNQKSKIIIYLGLILAVGVFLLKSDALGQDIRFAYEQRNDVSGYETITAGGRTELWIMSFNNLLTHPLGWIQKSYAHNLWLDLAKNGGWLSLIPFLIATVMMLKNMMICMKRKRSPFHVAILALCIAMILASSIEPVIEGSMLYFSLLMFVWGITAAIASEHKCLKIK